MTDLSGSDLADQARAPGDGWVGDLRLLRSLARVQFDAGSTAAWRAMEGAADEIERLRVKLAEAAESLEVRSKLGRTLHAELTGVRGQRDDLQAALERAAERIEALEVWEDAQLPEIDRRVRARRETNRLAQVDELVAERAARLAAEERADRLERAEGDAVSALVRAYEDARVADERAEAAEAREGRLLALETAIVKFEDHLPVPGNKRIGAPPDSYDRGYSEACDDLYDAFKPVAAALAVVPQPEPATEWHDHDCGPGFGGGWPHPHPVGVPQEQAPTEDSQR